MRAYLGGRDREMAKKLLVGLNFFSTCFSGGKAYPKLGSDVEQILDDNEPDIEWDVEPLGLEGAQFDWTARASTGSRFNVDWNIESGSPPPGVNVTYDDDEILFSGVATSPGSYTITLRLKVGDEDIEKTREDITFVIAPLNGPLTIYTNDLPSIHEGSHTVYAAQVIATGGTNSGYAWSVVSGNPPAGLTFSQASTGVWNLQCPAPSTGTYDFTVELMDDGANVTQKNLTIVIKAPIPLTPGS